jgi:cytoskeletal protein CcmA (bactofilin family)
MKFKEQKGAALVGVMMVLLILTLLGTTAFLNSSTDLKISGDYHQSLQALYAAEAGLQQLLSVYRQNPLHFLQKKTGQEMNFPLAEPKEPNGPGTKCWIDNLRYDPQETPAYVEVIMVGKDLIQNSLARVRATIFCSSSDVPAIFKTGMVTAGTLNLKGPLEISGNLHANRGYSVEPASVLEQLRSQQFQVTQSLDTTGPDFLPPQDIPLISEKGFQGYLSMAQQPGNQVFLGQQNLTLTGDQKGLLIFVDGDLSLTGSELSGATFVATGSITINGSASLKGDGLLDTAFIAGRDIIINDSSRVAGVFWSNGSMSKRGFGKLSGTVVSQGNITQMEGLQFERVSQISNTFLPPTSSSYSFTLKGWSQI